MLFLLLFRLSNYNSDDDLLNNETDSIIEQYAAMSDAIIIAWGSVGNNNQRVRERQSKLLEVLRPYANKLYKIGKEGYHPLTPIIRCKWELEPYELEVN